MRPNQPKSLLFDIAHHGNKIIEYAGTFSPDELKADDRTCSALLYKFSILGEAVNRLGGDFHQQHPDIPWRAMVSFRNVVVHGYDQIVYSELHRVIRVELPPVIDKMTELYDLY